MGTRADVFIIESLDLEDEKESRQEGEILSRILRLSGKAPIYYYIRTKSELVHLLREFRASRYRYLHLSCHGNHGAAFTTLDEIPFRELSDLLRSPLEKRRFFVSACSMANSALARPLLTKLGIYSMLGPARDVAFNDAAIVWATFYHLMFNQDTEAMRGAVIRRNAELTANTFEVPMNYYRRSSKSPW